jgi:ubiquinone/menaquinone biosynthesis C-methylase UbiE
MGGGPRSSRAASRGEDVLDVACGTGVVARLAARKVTPGHVTGLDLNSGMLAVARSVPNEGELVSWKEASALDLPFSSGHFDAVLCQLGLQFFPDQPKALREMRRVVRDSGRVALSVYSPIERTLGANTFVRALDEVLRCDCFDVLTRYSRLSLASRAATRIRPFARGSF